MSVQIKACTSCAFEIDVYSRVECSDHVWHWDWSQEIEDYKMPLAQFNLVDMCCRCGKDIEMVGK